MKKTLAVILTMGMLAAGLTACAGSSSENAAGTTAETAGTTAGAQTSEAAATTASGAITVVSREDGSGTRGAFIELFGIEQKNDAGEKVDYTTEDAEITNSTSVMMTTIGGNKDAIGYISLDRKSVV